jgi:ArsR family transcriptional regulator, arsenate/arsenite/antimonite-responsive transcriptional repressor
MGAVPAASVTVPPTVERATDSCDPLASTALDADQAEALAHRLKAIADPARLRVLSMLLTAEGGEACTCDLVDALGLSQPTVTHHMQRLAAVGLVEGERRSRRTWYRVVPGSLESITSVLRPG